MNIHDEIDDWMAGTLCDALSPEEQQNFEQHLAECPHCRSLYEETQKMNDTLNHTMPELRPDPNFERRVIAGFREKIAGSGFHPWRGLVWFVQFRSVQAALALVMLAALMQGGSAITGERAPWSTPIGRQADARDDGTSGNTRQRILERNLSPVVQKDAKETAQVDVQIRRAMPVTSVANPSLITKSGERAATSNISGDVGFQSYYSRGILQGSQDHVVISSGTLALTESNTYTGASTVMSGAGSLTLAGGNTEPPSAPVSQDGAGSLTRAGGNTHAIVDSIEQEDSKKASPIGGSDGNGFSSSFGGEISSGKAGGQITSGQVSGSAVIDTSKLIRNATLDFEVQSFEKALDTITAVASEEQGYVATQNSASGPNGKVQGEIVVKVLPAHLDRFLLKLRALGDIKNQNVSTEDVTKAYFDTEAHIHNSQIMEARLIDMLKNRTGRVSDLLDVEKEIGRVRGAIEEMQGRIKVYDAQVAYATITITLHEKDVNATAAYILREHAQLSLFAKDVDKAFADAKADADAAKAQTLESRIERDPDGRTSATLHLLIPPDASDEAISKLKALGRIQNFNSQTQRVARDGSGNSDIAKVEHDKVELNLVIQRDEENAVQGTNISVQTDKVEEQTAAIKQAAATAGIEIKDAEFNRAQNGAELSSLLLRMPVKKYAAFLEQIKSLGKVKDFTVNRREDTTATDDAPAEIALQIYSQPNIVGEDNGLWATIRHTLGEGTSALMWSLRMIGVSLAFIAPWAVVGGLALWLIVRRRKKMTNDE